MTSTGAYRKNATPITICMAGAALPSRLSPHLMIVLGMMQDPCANAIAFRKVGSTISTSVFSQLQWAVDMLGVTELWKCTTSPHRMIYTPTGQTILFRGLDSSRKLKSIKVSRGYLKYLWLEELDEYAGEAEIRSVQQSVLRGGDKYVVFKTFNPPISRTNWANQYVQTPRESALRHKSCYLDVPREWLGEQFFDDAEALKQSNPKAYEHEYLGVPTGSSVSHQLQILRSARLVRQRKLGKERRYALASDAVRTMLEAGAQRVGS